jgi:hypothetical protein
MSHRVTFKPLEQPLIRTPFQDDTGRITSRWSRWLDELYQLQTHIITYEADIAPGTVAANTTAEVDVTLSGVSSTSKILSVNKPTHTTGLGIVNYRVKAVDTVSITFMNSTGSGIDPGSEEYTIIVMEQ